MLFLAVISQCKNIWSHNRVQLQDTLELCDEVMVWMDEQIHSAQDAV